MPGKELDQQLKEFISSLEEQGVLDDMFDELKGLQDEQNPSFLEETITSFLATAENDIAQLTAYMMDEHNVNFREVTSLALKLKGTSSTIGGCQVARACDELRDASEKNNQEACLIVHDLISRDFLVLKQNLNQIVQMERTIIETEARRRDT